MNINDLNLTPEEFENAKRNAHELENYFQEAKKLMGTKQIAEANLILVGLLRRLKNLDNTNLNKSEIICCYGETLLFMNKAKEGKDLIRCCMIVWEQNGSERATSLLNKYSAIWGMDLLIPEIKPFKPRLSTTQKIKNLVARPFQASLKIDFPENVKRIAEMKYPM